MRSVYVNGQFVKEDEAKISVFDRGFLFADAVYEVTAVLNGKLLDFPSHMTRLKRSISELDMPFEVDEKELLSIHRQMIERNNLEEGMIYLQVTRGATDRDFAFDNKSLTPSLVLFTQKKAIADNPVAKTGIKIATIEDQRWGRCDIKTVQLLFPSLAKMEAKKQGADDAWLIRDGMVMEGTSNNAFIVTKDQKIITRHLSNQILHGITRASIFDQNISGYEFVERAFSIEEALEANEAFSTSASALVMPIIEINGVKIGDGLVGPIVTEIRQHYIETSLKRAL